MTGSGWSWLGLRCLVRRRGGSGARPGLWSRASSPIRAGRHPGIVRGRRLRPAGRGPIRGLAWACHPRSSMTGVSRIRRRLVPGGRPRRRPSRSGLVGSGLGLIGRGPGCVRRGSRGLVGAGSIRSRVSRGRPTRGWLGPLRPVVSGRSGGRPGPRIRWCRRGVAVLRSRIRGSRLPRWWRRILLWCGGFGGRTLTGLGLSCSCPGLGVASGWRGFGRRGRHECRRTGV